MKTTFLVDGFNLYHSIHDLFLNHRIKAKWLDVDAVLKSYLPHINTNAVIENIYYFTALRSYLQKTNPDTILRHIRYIKVLKSFGIKFEFGQFKKKNVKCKLCGGIFVKYEEKRTDVAIASKLISLAHNRNADVLIIVF